MKKRMGVALLMMVFITPVTQASLESEAQDYARMLQSQAPVQSQSDFERIQNQLSDMAPPSQAYQTTLDNIQSQFDKNMDRGLKDDDPIQQELHLHLQQSEDIGLAEQPTLQDAQRLLQQKNRWTVTEQDSALQGGSHQFHPILEDVHEVTCREGAKKQAKTCTQKRIVNVVTGEATTKNIKISFSGYLQNGALFSIDLKNGSVKTLNAIDLAKVNCDHNSNTYIAMNNCFINQKGTPQSVSSKASDYLSDEMASADLIVESAIVKIQALSYQSIGAIILEAPSKSNQYVAIVALLRYGYWYKDAPFYVFGFDVSWKVTSPPRQQIMDSWEGCEGLEARIDCEKYDSQPLDLDLTKTIEGYAQPIFRSHWTEKITFMCGLGTTVNECKAIQNQGCEQVGSQCAITKDNQCIEYEQTYRCAKMGPLVENDQGIQESVTAFLDGKVVNVPDDSYEAGEFGNAMTHFAAVKSMMSPMEDNLGGITGDSTNPSVFHGAERRCTVTLGSDIKDCCHLKGIAQGILGGCREEEKQLAQAAVKDKRCHKVANKYCTKEVLGVCVEKKDAYCCYGSEMANIIQEIAHHELDLPWGDGETPRCDSLTAEQLSRLDFDTPFAQAKLGQLISGYQATAQDKLNQVQGKMNPTQDYQNKLLVLQQKLQTQFHVPTQGAVSASGSQP